MITYSVEPFSEIIEEMKPLFQAHWKELALYQDTIQLDPDYSVYERAAQLGMLLMFSARQDGVLIGYAVFFLKRHPHYRTTIWAQSDIYWIAPEHRRGHVGAGLFAFVEDEFMARGVGVSQIGVKEAHPAAAKLLESLGYEKVEASYAKRLS